MSKENTTCYAILGLLSHEAMTGYDIKKRIDASVKYFWDAGYGQIYPALKALEAEGLVNKTSGVNGKGPEKIVYRLNEKGREKLKEWLISKNEKEHVRYDILLKLFFGNMLSIDENINRIREFELRNSEKHNLMEGYSEELKGITENRDHLYFYLTALFGKHVYKAYMDWAEEAIDILEKTKEP